MVEAGGSPEKETRSLDDTEEKEGIGRLCDAWDTSIVHMYE